MEDRQTPSAPGNEKFVRVSASVRKANKKGTRGSFSPQWFYVQDLVRPGSEHIFWDMWFRHLLQEILSHIGQPKSINLIAHCAMYCHLGESRDVMYSNDPRASIVTSFSMHNGLLCKTTDFEMCGTGTCYKKYHLMLVSSKSGIHSLQSPLCSRQWCLLYLFLSLVSLVWPVWDQSRGLSVNKRPKNLTKLRPGEISQINLNGVRIWRQLHRKWESNWHFPYIEIPSIYTPSPLPRGLNDYCQTDFLPHSTRQTVSVFGLFSKE